MPLPDYRNSTDWQDAIKLGPGLVRLCEELPAAEQMGLSWQLQQLMVELPAAIAYDIIEVGSNTRQGYVFRLQAAMDLIDTIYPALDTAATRANVDRLIDRITGDNLQDVAGVDPVSFPDTPLPTEPPDPVLQGVPVVPEEMAPQQPEVSQPPSQSVPVQQVQPQVQFQPASYAPSPDTSAVPSPPVTVNVQPSMPQITPAEEPHVQPNSFQ